MKFVLVGRVVTMDEFADRAGERCGVRRWQHDQRGGGLQMRLHPPDLSAQRRSTRRVSSSRG